MAVTIYNVAKEIGVSSGTVSRALNNHPRVSERTRKRVEDVAKRLGYRQCVQGRFLRTGKTFTIGAVVPDLTNPYYVEIMREIEVICQDKGYRLLIMEYMQDASRERMILEQMLERQCDAVVTTITLLKPVKDLIEEFYRIHVPCVAIGLPMDTDGCWVDGTSIDMDYAMESAVGHLVELGHKDIAFIASFRPDFKGFERIDGIKNAFKRHDIPFNEKKVIVRRFSGNYFDDGVCAIDEILSKNEKITAVICHNDLVATGVMQKLYKSKVYVPNDMSVISIDNTWLSTALPITLTSIDQQKKKNAQIVTQILFDRLNNEFWNSPQQVRIKPNLIIRNSTGKARI